MRGKSIYQKFGLFLCAASMILLTGCSNNKGANSSIITLYWWRPKSDASEATLEQIAQDYMTDHRSVKIEVVTVDPRNYNEQVTNALASYQSITNAPDIFSIGVEDLPKFASQLVPAADNLFDSQQTQQNAKTGKSSTEYVKDLYEDVVGKSCILKDSSGSEKVYGLPMALDTLALYINTAAIERAVQSIQDKNHINATYSQNELVSIKKQIQTAPTTWTDLTQIVPYLTIRDGNNITQSAIALGTGSNIERSYDILQTMMMQNGTQMTSADKNSAAFNLSTNEAGSATTTTPGLRALDFYMQFSNPNSSLYTWNDKMPNDVEAFEQGQVAMIIHYADLYRFLIAEAPSIKSTIDVQPLPQVTDPTSPIAQEQLKTMGKMNIEVASSAKGDATRQRAAWDFIYYVTSRQGSNTYLSAQKLPSALKDVNGQPKFQAFYNEKSWSDLWYKGVKAQNIDETFIKMIDDASNGTKTSKEALDQAAKDTSIILSGSKTKWADSSQ